MLFKNNCTPETFTVPIAFSTGSYIMDNYNVAKQNMIYHLKYRSSCAEVFCKKGLLKILAKFKGNSQES